MGTNEVELDTLGLYFGKELCQHDRWAIKNFGMPKYRCGTPVAICGGDPGTEGHHFVVQGMFWSDLLHSWVYYVPTYNFYQCESDLRETYASAN